MSSTQSSDGTRELWIDDRYRGAHGIGRYAHEVISRLTIPWRSLGLEGAPSKPSDSFRRLPPASRRGLIYSPGYGAFLGADKQILTVHDLIHLKVGWPGRAKYLAYYNGPVRRAIRRAGVVLTVSETSRREIQEWVRDDDVEVVNAGIGCSPYFTPAPEPSPAGDPFVLFVGNLRTHKNLVTVMKAMSGTEGVALRAVIPTAEIVEAQALAQECGVANRVAWISDLDDAGMAELYRRAAATVMPSLLEGFGLPALESIRCGTPVIYWEGCSAVTETVGARGAGVSGGRDAAEWADQIARFAAERVRIEPPSSSGYDWNRVAERVEHALVAHTSKEQGGY